LKTLPRAASRPCRNRSRKPCDALEADPLFAEVLGPQIVGEFIKLKRMEWVEYSRHVSDWEIKRYTEFF
jgi:glutamine synthetase